MNSARLGARIAADAHLRGAFTLIETMILMAIVAVMTAMALPSFSRWTANQRLQSSAIEVAGAFSYARSEAIRTGNVHLVLFQEDAQGNALPASSIRVHDDGQLGTAGQNCVTDAGETSRTFLLEDDVSFGPTNASGKVAVDSGAAAISDGSTFEDASGNPATWVLFRPEGTPRAFSSDCTIGVGGDGGGGVYLTNGQRDLAIVLSPLGASHLYRWAEGASSWTN